MRSQSRIYAFALLITVLPSLAFLAFAGRGHKTRSQEQGSRTPFFSAHQDLRSVFDHVTGKDSRPVIKLMIYDDGTRSRLGSGAEYGSWLDLSSCVREFWLQAAPGSRCEVYVTGEHAGHPTLVAQYDVLENLRQRARREKAEASVQEIEQRGKELIQNPPPASESCILEDTHFLAQRAADLPRVDREVRWIIVATDCQQYSKSVTSDQIIQAKDDQTKKVLIDRVLAKMPQLSIPPTWVSVIYFPGNIGTETLSAAEEKQLKEFFQRVVEVWGAPCEIIQPGHLDNAH